MRPDDDVMAVERGDKEGSAEKSKGVSLGAEGKECSSTTRLDASLVGVSELLGSGRSVGDGDWALWLHSGGPHVLGMFNSNKLGSAVAMNGRDIRKVQTSSSSSSSSSFSTLGATCWLTIVAAVGRGWDKTTKEEFVIEVPS